MRKDVFKYFLNSHPKIYFYFKEILNAASIAFLNSSILGFDLSVYRTFAQK